MRRVWAWLSRIGGGKKLSPLLPEDLQKILAAGSIKDSKQVLELWAHSEAATESAVKDFLKRAQEAAWPTDELEKLAIHLDYFKGRNDSAYRRIKAAKLEQSDFDYYVIACISLYVLDRFEEAYALLRTHQPEEPEFSEHPLFLSFAGYIVVAAGGEMREAVRYFDIGLEMGMSSIPFLTNAYGIYFEAGELEKAERLRRIIYEQKVNDPQVLFAVACVELARDYYPEGFRLAESRYDHPEVARHMNPELLKKPMWRGQDLRGKRLLVHGEQGLGDTVMCARYLPLLVNAGIDVVFDCQDAAASLLEHNYPQIEIINRDTPLALSLEFDYWIGAMSLPHLLNSSADTIPGLHGYMTVSREHREHWRERIGGQQGDGRFRIGIAWSGNPKHRSDRRRSIGLKAMFPFIQKHTGAQFYALQTSVPEFLPENLLEFADEMMTLSDTAALITEMDLVITVDTSIVHLAGALGKPTWLLFPYRYEWRWGLTGEQNSWYDSVRVIRQMDHGDWSPVLAKIFDQLLPEVLLKHAGEVQ